MSLELYRKVKALEARVAELENRKPQVDGAILHAVVKQMLDSMALASLPAARGLCPKCGVKPNHFFHVKNCRGQQKEEQNEVRGG